MFACEHKNWFIFCPRVKVNVIIGKTIVSTDPFDLFLNVFQLSLLTPHKANTVAVVFR
jgi:hypothetical protein